MAYCSNSDVQIACGGRQRLIELTDQENSGEVNQAVLDAARTTAESWINSKIGPRFAVQLVDPLPPIIVQYAARETKFQLMDQRGMVTTEEKDARETRDKFFTDVKDGKVSLGVEPPPGKSSSVKATWVARDCDEDVSRESLKGALT
jgi:phage gp36-like protein